MSYVYRFSTASLFSCLSSLLFDNFLTAILKEKLFYTIKTSSSFLVIAIERRKQKKKCHFLLLLNITSLWTLRNSINLLFCVISIIDSRKKKSKLFIVEFSALAFYRPQGETFSMLLFNYYGVKRILIEFQGILVEEKKHERICRGSLGDEKWLYKIQQLKDKL